MSYHWKEEDVKSQKYKDFVVKTNILLRRYGSFNGLIELCQLELLTSAEKLQKNKRCYFTLEFTETACTCIMSPTGAS